MASKGFVRLNAIWKMLSHCAPGHERTLKTHHWWVRWNGRTFRTLPKGPGRYTNAEVRLQYVGKLVAVLGIDIDCAARFFPQLR